MIELDQKDAKYIADRLREESGYEVTPRNIIGFVIGLKERGIEVYNEHELIHLIIKSIRETKPLNLSLHNRPNSQNVPDFMRI